MKFGFTKTRTALPRPADTRNKAGSKAYSIENPSIRLISLLGQYFNEPTYYGATKESLQPEAVNLIETAIQVAEGDTPADLIKIAHWCRSKMNYRTTPAVLLAIAAAAPAFKGSGQIRDYCSKVCQRPDDATQVIAAYLGLFTDNTPWTRKAIPNSLKRGLADYISKVPTPTLLKYSGGDHPSMADLLKLVDRAKDYPVSKAVAKFITSGEVLPDAPSVIRDRKEFFTSKKFNPQLAEKLGLTWENVISAFGSSKETWEWAAFHMPYMATLRNLRNLEEAGVSHRAWEAVEARLIQEASSGRQHPYRYLAAMRAVSTVKAREVVEGAFIEACKNTFVLQGSTAIFVDTSGSMDCGVSGKSTMSCLDAATALAATLHASGNETHIIPFGTTAEYLQFTKYTRPWELIEKIMEGRGRRGYGTSVDAAIKELNRRKIKVDRIIVLSDMQLWLHSSDMQLWLHSGSGSYYAPSTGMQKELTYYRNHINRNVFMYCVNLAGEGTSQVDPKENRNIQMSGFSDNIFQHIAEIENPSDQSSTTTRKVKKSQAFDPEALLRIIRRDF